jgi:hypothetical protein
MPTLSLDIIRYNTQYGQIIIYPISYYKVISKDEKTGRKFEKRQRIIG